MPGRTTNYGNYRYAYNGMEQDNEVSGNGNSYTTEFRQYDPRLGRWKSLDPLMKRFPWMSPYVAFNDNPVRYLDPYGLSSQKNKNGKGKDDDPVSVTGNRSRPKSDGYWSNDEFHEWKVGDEYISTKSNKSFILGADGEWSVASVEEEVFVSAKEGLSKFAIAKAMLYSQRELNGLIKVLEWMDKNTGKGDNTSGGGSFRLVTDDPKPGMQGPARKSNSGGSNEVNADKLGMSKAGGSGFNGMAKDWGDKAKQLANAFKDGAKVGDILSSSESESPELRQKNAEQVYYLVRQRNWNQEPSDVGEGVRWSGPIDNSFEKSMTLEEINVEYPNAEWDTEEKAFVINNSAPNN